MSLLSPPQIPLFRITLFYGPEIVEGASDSIHCVFNVKKRSWKGGVQVDVVMNQRQLIGLESVLEHPAWLKSLLNNIAEEEQKDYLEKSRDLLIQLVCFYKLQIFIQEGIRQENIQISGDSYIDEVNEAVQREAENLKRQICVELDLTATEE